MCRWVGANACVCVLRERERESFFVCWGLSVCVCISV